jgi:hypothetical protein
VVRYRINICLTDGAQPVENGSPVVSRTPIRLSNIFELSVRMIDISIIFASTRWPATAQTSAMLRMDENLCLGRNEESFRMSVFESSRVMFTLHQFEPAVTTVTDNRGIHLVIHDRTVLPPSKKLSNCLSICCLVRLNEDRWSEK